MVAILAGSSPLLRHPQSQFLQVHRRTVGTAPPRAAPVVCKSGKKKGADKPMKRSGILDISGLPAWVVEKIGPSLYPPSDCGPGRYYDPNSEQCVYICRPGYTFNLQTKSCQHDLECGKGYMLSEDGISCVLREDDPEGPAAGAVPAKPRQPVDGRSEAIRKAVSGPVVPQVFPGRQKGDLFYTLTWRQKVATWVSAAVFGDAAGEGADSPCPVGFYYDKEVNACVLLCAPGYHYDKQLGTCVENET